MGVGGSGVAVRGAGVAVAATVIAVATLVAEAGGAEVVAVAVVVVTTNVSETDVVCCGVAGDVPAATVAVAFESFFEEPPQAAVDSTIAARSAAAAMGAQVFICLPWGLDRCPLSAEECARAKDAVHIRSRKGAASLPKRRPFSCCAQQAEPSGGVSRALRYRRS